MGSTFPAGWPKAVVFDLDGTLVDSVGDLGTALNAVLERQGLRPHTLDEVRRMIGGGVRVLLQRAHLAQGRTLSDEAVGPLAEAFLAHYRPRATETTVLYPGAVELIEEMAQAGVKLAVCTNKPTDISVTILETLGLAHRFAAIVGAEEGMPRKPDPASLRLTLKRLGVAPHEAVMIGDSAADVGCARGGGHAGDRGRLWLHAHAARRAGRRRADREPRRGMGRHCGACRPWRVAANVKQCRLIADTAPLRVRPQVLPGPREQGLGAGLKRC